MKKLMLVINPAAGREGYRFYFGEAMHELARGGFTPTLFFTGGHGDATQMVLDHASAFDQIACVGGDGTLSEVMAGLVRIPDPPPLGYIPMGTANDVATTLGLAKNDMVGAVQQMLAGTPHPYDVGRFGEDETFAYIAAFGAFTDVSYATPQSQKRSLGQLAYVLQGAAQIGKIAPYHTRVEYDDGVFEGDLMFGSMSNSTSVAGIVRLRDEMVSLGDGMSELLLVKDPVRIDAYGELAAAVLSRTFDNENLLILHTKQAKFTFDRPVAWTRDGESGGEHQEIVVRNLPAAIRFIF